MHKLARWRCIPRVRYRCLRPCYAAAVAESTASIINVSSDRCNRRGIKIAAAPALHLCDSRGASYTSIPDPGARDCQPEIRTMIPPGVLVVTSGTIRENNKSFSEAWSVESRRVPRGWSAIVRKMWIGIGESGKRRNINVNATGLEGPSGGLYRGRGEL